VFDLGKVLLTAVGGELTKISNVQGDTDYEKTQLKKWSDSGWKEASVSSTAEAPQGEKSETK
jgi:hypothetical protein